MTTRYRQGRDLEYRVRDVLTDAGYFTVRSPGSKSPADVIAVKVGQVLLVQCKRSGSLPPAEWNKLYDLALSVGAVPLMAEWIPRKPVAFWQLTARKDGSGRRQPMEPFSVDEVADAP